MTLTRLVFVCAAGFAVCGSSISPARADAAKREAQRAAGDAAPVERVLRQEVAGGVDRRAALAEILRSRSDSPFARWQAGYVRDGRDAWRAFDEAPLSDALQSKLAEYRSRRAATPATAAGQRDLANWCRRQDLPDQEQAHLYAVLALDPEADHSQVFARLGFRQVAGQWLTPEQLREWRELNRQTEASLKRWGPRLERIARQLSGPAPQQQAAGRALRELKEPSAIPAIELMLAGHDERSALAAVETLGRMEVHAASIALAKQGVFSRWQSVRDAAAGSLKPRRLEDVVPPLISLLATPIQADFQLHDAGLQPRLESHVGALFYSLVLWRETKDQFQVSTFRTINVMTDDYVSQQENRPVSGSRFALERGRSDAVRALNDQLHAQKKTIDELNERTAELNGRIAAVLAAVSGEQPVADARKWWSWWNGYSDLERVGDKPTVTVDETEIVGDQSAPIVHEPRPTIFDELLAMRSCFAAETPVWTETGPMPIEKIQVGDRVLAQDIETGELAYKPVLQTTIRPPKELTTLRFGEETIICTGGHRFWQSGTGWVKARDIEPQSLFHTATGNTPVWSARKGQTAATYNLVVADYHTYFVGQSALLCQDLLPPRSTNKAVPGVDRSRITATAR